MANANKKTLEILLENIDISRVTAPKKSKHLVNGCLIWPRPLIASKSSVKTVDFAGGKAEMTNRTWVERVLFKESVEHRFGLQLEISESVTTSSLRKFLRFMGSSLLGIGADAVEDVVEAHVPGPLGEVVGAPLDYGKKRLAETYVPYVILEGTVDLVPTALEGTVRIEIPLKTTKGIYTTVHAPAAPKGSTGTKRKLLFAEGTELGKAILNINVLD